MRLQAVRVESARFRLPLLPLCFGQGQVTVYSDFDGTYLPVSHKAVTQASGTAELSKLADYFTNLRTFLQKHKRAIQLKITTGRNLGEFQFLLRQLKQIGLQMPLPDSVITKNGRDEYYKVLEDAEYYQDLIDHALPYREPGNHTNPEKFVNIQKRQNIHQLTGWNGEAIRKKIIEILKAYQFEIRHDLTTNSAQDYGESSTLSHVQDQYPAKQSPWVAALRQDGDLHFFIGLPKDINHREDRKEIKAKLLSRLNAALENICRPWSAPDTKGFILEDHHLHWEYGDHPALILSPQWEGHPLTKIYDTQKAVKEASKNNDLVIVAGDDRNDFEMLNPVRYLQLPEPLSKHNQETPFVNDPYKMKEILASHPDLQAQLDRLPLMGIVIIRQGQPHPDLQALVECYGTGKYPKIIAVPEGQLTEGILQGIERFRAQNPMFGQYWQSSIKSNPPTQRSERVIVRFFRTIWQAIKAFFSKLFSKLF